LALSAVIAPPAPPNEDSPGPSVSAAVGAASNAFFASEADATASYERLARGGIGWVRETFYWDNLEPRRGRFHWAPADHVMLAAARAGVQVVAVLAYSAAWASSDPNGNNTRFPPQKPEEFAAYAAAVAARYGTGGAFWRRHPDLSPSPLRVVEVWNEPWLSSSWRPNPDPVAYADLLRVAARAVHRVQPKTQILASGDLAQVRAHGEPRGWLTELLAADRQIGDSIAGWSVHPYPEPRDAGPMDEVAESFGFDRVEEIRRLTVEGGVPDPIWITEIGWTTARRAAEGVSEADQARFVVDAIARSLDEWHEFVARTFVYSWSRSGVDPEDPEEHYGLLRSDGSAKPAWQALRRALASREAGAP
jgi:hypothetical protein